MRRFTTAIAQELAMARRVIWLAPIVAHVGPNLLSRITSALMCITHDVRATSEQRLAETMSCQQQAFLDARRAMQHDMQSSIQLIVT